MKIPFHPVFYMLKWKFDTEFMQLQGRYSFNTINFSFVFSFTITSFFEFHITNNYLINIRLKSNSRTKNAQFILQFNKIQF